MLRNFYKCACMEQEAKKEISIYVRKTQNIKERNEKKKNKIRKKKKKLSQTFDLFDVYFIC